MYDKLQTGEDEITMLIMLLLRLILMNNIPII